MYSVWFGIEMPPNFAPAAIAMVSILLNSSYYHTAQDSQPLLLHLTYPGSNLRSCKPLLRPDFCVCSERDFFLSSSSAQQQTKNAKEENRWLSTSTELQAGTLKNGLRAHAAASTRSRSQNPLTHFLDTFPPSSLARSKKRFHISACVCRVLGSNLISHTLAN